MLNIIVFKLIIIIAVVIFMMACDKDEIVSPEEEQPVVTPTVTTAEIIDITETTAIGGGEITDDGGAEITARGTVWSTSVNPIIHDTRTIDGTGVGTFISYITGLQPDTIHYARAYATNSRGTGYGEQVSFRTAGWDHETGTVTDIDGNEYQTVKIGNQWWMAENLRVTRYRNGDAIPTGLSITAWENTTSGAYAIYPHDDVDGINSDGEMVDAYGKLYNWYAVDDDHGLCPVGWHVPSDEEWKELEMHLGMSQQDTESTVRRGTDEGGKLKSTRTLPVAHPRWRSPNEGATNESGFSGLPGGVRYASGYYHLIGSYGAFWSSTESSTSNAWPRYLSYVSSIVIRYNIDKQIGRSVRCLRDE